MKNILKILAANNIPVVDGKINKSHRAKAVQIIRVLAKKEETPVHDITNAVDNFPEISKGLHLILPTEAKQMEDLLDEMVAIINSSNWTKSYQEEAKSAAAVTADWPAKKMDRFPYAVGSLQEVCKNLIKALNKLVEASEKEPDASANLIGITRYAKGEIKMAEESLKEAKEALASTVLADAESDKIELVQLICYHLDLASTLKWDLEGQGETDDDGNPLPGYNPPLTKKLIKKYNAKDWKEAYKKASDFHSKRASELKAKFKKEFKEDYYTTYEKYEGDIHAWIQKHISLGEEPKKALAAAPSQTLEQKIMSLVDAEYEVLKGMSKEDFHDYLSSTFPDLDKKVSDNIWKSAGIK